MTYLTRNEELQFIKNFIMETYDGFYFQYLYWQQLQALWTAFCFHHKLTTDKPEYDGLVHIMYDTIINQLKERNHDIKYSNFETFEKFDLYMSMLLK